MSTIMPRRFISRTTSLPNGVRPSCLRNAGVVDIALRVGPVVGVEVGEGHVADAEGVVVAEEAQRVLDGVTAFDAHESGDLVIFMCGDDFVRRRGEDEVVGVVGNDVGADCVDHLKGAVGGVIALYVLGIDVDGKEFGAKEALHAGKIGLATLVGCGDIVAGDGFGGDVIVGIDEDGFASDLVDFSVGYLVLGEGDGGEKKSEGGEGAESGQGGSFRRANFLFKCDERAPKL